MLLIKNSSVRFGSLRPEIVAVLNTAIEVWTKYGKETTLTSANDSQHMTRSLHYVDRAVDLRSHDLEPGIKQAIFHDLRDKLGEGYDILFEQPGTAEEHFHVEFDPKEAK